MPLAPARWRSTNGFLARVGGPDCGGSHLSAGVVSPSEEHPMPSLDLAAGSLRVRTTCALGGCRVSSRCHGSSLANRPYGATPDPDDSERAAHSAGRSGDCPVEWIGETGMRANCHASVGLLARWNRNGNRLAHSQPI